MTIGRSKPSGFSYHDKFTAVEAEIIDSQLPNAIDGKDGGAYAPSTPVDISGSGFIYRTTLDTAATCSTTLNGDVQFPNGFTCTGTASTSFGDNSVNIGSGGEFTAHCSSFLNGDVNFTSVGGSVFQCDKPTDFTRNVGFIGLLTCSGGLRTATADTNLESNTNIIGGATVTSVIAITGAGRVRHRHVSGVNADHTYSVADADVVDVPTLTGNHTYTISSTGAGRGDSMLFTMTSDNTLVSTNGIILSRQSDSTQIGPSIVKNTGSIVCMAIVFDGAEWQPMNWAPYI